MMTFIAFYPSRPFWIDKQIDFNLGEFPANLNDEKRKEFYNKMAEEVYVVEGVGYTLRFCRDGQIMLRINKLESVNENRGDSDLDLEMKGCIEKWGYYLDYLNTFYLLLDSAALEIDKSSLFSLHEITNRDAFQVGPVEGMDGKMLPRNRSNESIASFLINGRDISNYRQNLPIYYDDRLLHRPTISLAAIKHASETFSKIMYSNGLEKILASFSKSLSEYKITNYRNSVLFSWFIIEAGVNKIWEDYLDELKQNSPKEYNRINQKRKKFLTGKNFTISIISNVLELFNLLPDEIFKKIDKTRKIRNKIVHSLDNPTTAEDAKLVMQTAKEMIKHLWNLHFEFSEGYSIRAL